MPSSARLSRLLRQGRLTQWRWGFSGSGVGHDRAFLNFLRAIHGVAQTMNFAHLCHAAKSEAFIAPTKRQA